MQTNSGKSGKCSNFGNCSLADARTTIEVPTGLDFVCNECGKPLLQTDGGGAQVGGSKALLIGLGLAALLLLVGGGGAWFFGKKTPEVVAAPASAPAPATVREQVPITGTCSEADERAGLCRTH